MKAVERAAIVRIMTDLIKADRIIDIREMNLYDTLRKKYSLQNDDECNATSMTLGKAINTLVKVPNDIKNELMADFYALSNCDFLCAREEALLMLALFACLSSEKFDADTLSYPLEDSLFDSGQVLYVESYYDNDTNNAITTQWRSLDTEFRAAGFEFVYIPKIREHYVATDPALFVSVVRMLVPTLTIDEALRLHEQLRNFQTAAFCIDQLHRKLGFTDLIDTPPAILIPVSRTKIKDKTYGNYLRVEVDADIVATTRSLMDRFLEYHAANTIFLRNSRDEHGAYLFSGFYRNMLELLLLRKTVNCPLEVDFVNNQLGFREIEVTLKSLHRKEKALFVLFVFEAWVGAVRNSAGKWMRSGSINFNTQRSTSLPLRHNKRIDLLQRRYTRIYLAFGGDAMKAPDITRSEIRQPMLTGIRKAIGALGDRVYQAELLIPYRHSNGVYGLRANPELFTCRDLSSADPFPLVESRLFTDLKSMK